MGHASIAIETLRAAIYRMPEEAVLWNSLATVLAESGRAEESLVFYREAVRLAPGFSRPYHNMGFAYQHLGRLSEALEAYDCALEHAVDEGEKIEGRHSRSICLIGMGRLEEGFREYEIRNNPRFRAYVQIVSKAPRWQGEDLNGKRMLVIGEQGLGDEFMFANILPDLARAVGPDGKLQIAVDKRLTGLFQRSFPAADVGAYDDRRFTNRDGSHELRLVPWAEEGGTTPDFHMMMGSALQYLRKDVSDFPHDAFLVPDPGRVEQMRAQLAQWGPGPFVGMCWRSMMLGVKRSKYYSVLDDWGPIL
jgi:tetratricopeptide (TPR) repeat protein